jgi:hypothetical protein
MCEAPLSIGNPRRYSLNWALRVVQTWEEAHTRVTKILYKFQEMSSVTLAKLLVFRPKDWYNLKRWAKYLDKSWILVDQGFETTKQMLSSSIKLFEEMTHATVFVHLTACLESTMLEEPIERGASPEATAKGEALPSLSGFDLEAFN